MPTISELRSRTWSRFMAPPAPRISRAKARFAPDLLTAEVAPAAPPVPARFSAFDPEQLDRALAVAAEHMRRADSAPGEEGLARVLDHDDELRGDEDPDLLDHALMVFIAHHPRGRKLAPAVPRLTVRAPERVAPSGALAAEIPRSAMAAARALPTGPAAGVAAEAEALFADAALLASPFAGGVLPAPDGLEWFREDPFANEHHLHWHVVYPTGGVPDPADPARRRFKDRQGELFFFMHRQMLARYDAERRALGLAPVDPLADYREAMALGYDPGDVLRPVYGARPPDRPLVPLPGYDLDDHELRRDRLREAIAAGRFATSPPRALDSDLLGGTVEANGRGVHGPRPAATSFYGNLHNLGHGLIAGASDGEPGVMRDPATAIRDPVFWRWHQHVDDFYAAWQEKLGPRDFADRPLVRMRKGFDPAAGAAASPDVCFLFEDALPPEAAGDGLAAWAAERYGGDRWDDDPAADPLVTSTLETWMLERDLTLSDRRTTVPLAHLVHRPFVAVYRVENPLDRAWRLTLRTFCAPREAAEERRAWIELDKFAVEVGPGERAVFARRGSQSVVVRKPAVLVPDLLKQGAFVFDAETLAAFADGSLSAATVARLAELDGRVFLATRREVDGLVAALRARVPQGEISRVFEIVEAAAFRPSEQPLPPQPGVDPAELEAIEAANYCTCGWPYNLLLPRGTPEGAPYRLAVMATDGDLDQAGGSERCGSLSFCGARESYPDLRPMGYPFDLPFADGIRDTFLALGNAALADFAIRRLEDVAGDRADG